MARDQKRAKVELTADQVADAELICERIRAKVDGQVREMARLMA